MSRDVIGALLVAVRTNRKESGCIWAKENARGGRAFSIVVHLGLVGSSTYSRGDFGGLIKRPREFLNS
jgi:hypothetical protein